MPKSSLPVPAVSEETIVEKIFIIRGQKVMLDKDLAEMYGVPTFRLNEAVKRNMSRFPDDFMFQLTKDEYDSLRSQIAILKRGKHSKYSPYAFTEQGVAMLSRRSQFGNGHPGEHSDYPIIYKNETIDSRQQRPLDED